MSSVVSMNVPQMRARGPVLARGEIIIHPEEGEDFVVQETEAYGQEKQLDVAEQRKRANEAAEVDYQAALLEQEPEQEEQEELGGGLDFVADEPAVHEPVRRREPEPRPDPLESAIRALERTPIRQAAFVPTPRGPDPDDPDPGRGVVARLEVPRDGVGRTSVLPFIVALFLLTWAGLGPN